MLKRATSYTFFVIVYLSGILLGGIYTADVIAYAKQFDAQNTIEEQTIKQKPQQKKKRHKLVQVG